MYASLDLKGDVIMNETHDDVIRGKKLPRVGQTVRSRKHGTLWRVIEKREIWQNISDDPDTGQPRLLPAIFLTYTQVKKGQHPGRKLGYAYTLNDNTFEANWEIADEQ
jgi:hypothetical protein